MLGAVSKAASYLDCDVLHVIINVLPTEGSPLLGRSWGGERLRGRAFPRRAFTGGFALFAQPSRDLAGDSSNIATAYAEMHVKIAKCKHQMSVDVKVHACVQATVQLQLRAA
jgi:hypothetical protein